MSTKGVDGTPTKCVKTTYKGFSYGEHQFLIDGKTNSYINHSPAEYTYTKGQYILDSRYLVFYEGHGNVVYIERIEDELTTPADYLESKLED